ncbi:hypothetical protein CXG81DRAFT_18416 [Caulochytrium protostelioides]|uniref:Uncharacterized protein n=1 Tax=Caulochytrium protostelioides TaxID=1555241 RepID=A0A4P9X991_9FUNG|nr:hypothetical protein CXG81DRAFT_18416 [Caulochytrium protostelioides]|eukprot:RKP01852.1 hypothetical protein CXG81DRAFT_18416 [Caulochytrium protostelioides]
MSHYETPVPQEVRENPRFLAYRRRLLHPRKLERHARRGQPVRLLALGASLVGAAAVVLAVDRDADQGADRSWHIFTAPRRWAAERWERFLRLRVRDTQELAGLGYWPPTAPPPCMPTSDAAAMTSSLSDGR